MLAHCVQLSLLWGICPLRRRNLTPYSLGSQQPPDPQKGGPSGGWLELKPQVFNLDSALRFEGVVGRLGLAGRREEEDGRAPRCLLAG